MGDEIDIKDITARLYRPGEKKYTGTAWLCSENYALTAAHCVGDRKQRVTIGGTYRLRFPWGEREAEVKRYDFDLDAALLSIKGGDKIPKTVMLALGQLPAENPWPVGRDGYTWQSWGYASGNPSAMSIYGIIDTPDGYITDDPDAEEEKTQIAIQLTCEQGGFNNLPGMSGAAVSYKKNIIIGLVRWAPPSFQQKVIYAVPLKSVVKVFPELEEILNANLKFAIEQIAPNLLTPSGAPPVPDAGRAPAAGGPAAPQGTKLFGREKDIAAIGRLLREERVRLLTLVGPRGTGKTVLAQAVGRELQSDYQNGVHFIDLGLVKHADMVASEIAHVLGVKETRVGSFEESLVAYLGDRPTLLILDGFEDLDRARPLVETLLAKSAGLQVVVTCRDELGWLRERVYRVEPLTLGAGGEDSPAVTLFRDRARRANPEYKFDPATLGDINGICEKLGGLPLAIELAAAQSAAPGFSPARVLEELNGHDGPEPGGQLAALVGICYGSLGEGMQECLRRLTVFSGPVTPEAAEAVVASDGAETQGSVREELAQLFGRSLLCEEKRPGGGVRYRMPRPVLEYCAEQLEEAGESASACRSHAVYYSQLTRKAERRLNLLSSAERREWLERLEAEHEEIRTAINWSRGGAGDADKGNIDIALEIVGNMFWFWNLRAYLTEGRRWVEEVLAEARPHLKGETESLGKALYCAGGLAYMHGDYADARALLDESIGVWTKLSNRRRRGYALIVLGMVSLNQNRLGEAREHEEECVELFREVDDRWGLALALNDLANVCLESNEIEEARANYQKSLAVWRELGDQWGYGLTTSNLGLLSDRAGDPLTAKQLLINASAMQRDEGNDWGWAESIKRLGHISLKEKEYRQAAKLFYDSMALHQKIGRKQLVADCLDGLAQVAAALDQPGHAARLFGAATAIRNQIGARMSPPQAAAREQSIAAAREVAGRKGMTDEEFLKAQQEGEGWALEVAVAQATICAKEWTA